MVLHSICLPCSRAAVTQLHLDFLQDAKLFYCHYTSIVEQNLKARWNYGLEPLQLRHAATVGQLDLEVFDAGNAERQREWELPHSQTAIVDGD